MPKALNLKGQRFGKLIAIKKAKSKMEKLIGYVDAIVGVRNNLNLVNLG